MMLTLVNNDSRVVRWKSKPGICTDCIPKDVEGNVFTLVCKSVHMGVYGGAP